MNFEFKKLNHKDHKRIIGYAIKGMHFNIYLKSKLLIKMYGKYFWYLELLNATQILALYVNNELAGVLLADMYDETKCYKSFSKKLYVKFIDFIQKIFFKNSVSTYDEANKKMLDEYKKNNKPDGEIRFLAANPDLKIKGIGTKLLDELERREKKKEIYLFTDDLCTYQFYEHRGFEKMNEEDIILKLEVETPLKCFLYRKKL